MYIHGAEHGPASLNSGLTCDAAVEALQLGQCSTSWPSTWGGEIQAGTLAIHALLGAAVVGAAPNEGGLWSQRELQEGRRQARVLELLFFLDVAHVWNSDVTALVSI